MRTSCEYECRKVHSRREMAGMKRLFCRVELTQCPSLFKGGAIEQANETIGVHTKVE